MIYNIIIGAYHTVAVSPLNQGVNSVIPLFEQEGGDAYGYMGNDDFRRLFYYCIFPWFHYGTNIKISVIKTEMTACPDKFGGLIC